MVVTVVGTRVYTYVGQRSHGTDIASVMKFTGYLSLSVVLLESETDGRKLSFND